MVNALEINVDGTVVPAELPQNRGAVLIELQEIVGGYIERVPTPLLDNDNYSMYVNEEGILLNLSRNVLATKIAEFYGFGGRLFGNAVIVTEDHSDFPEHFLSMIRTIANA